MRKPRVLVAAIRCAPGKCEADAQYARMIARSISEGGLFNLTVDAGHTFATTPANKKFDIALVPHGNRHLKHQAKRMEFIDARCKNVWCIMSTPLLEYIIFDREGYSGGNSLALRPDALDVDSVLEKNAEETFAHLQRVYVSANRSKYKQPHLSDFKAKKPFVLFLGQVSGDTAVNFSHFKVSGSDTSAHYVKTLLTAFPILDGWGIPIIYKTHPREASGYNIAINELLDGPLFNHVTVNRDASIHELLAQCLGVMSINSGAAFEGLMHLKPVVTMGAVDYSHGTFNCKNAVDIEKALAFLQKPVEEMHAKKFLHAYLARTYPTHGRDTFAKLVGHLLDLPPGAGAEPIYFLGRKTWNTSLVEYGMGAHTG